MAAASPLSTGLHTRGQGLALAVLALFGLVVIPGLNALPADSPLNLPDYLQSRGRMLTTTALS